MHLDKVEFLQKTTYVKDLRFNKKMLRFEKENGSINIFDISNGNSIINHGYSKDDYNIGSDEKGSFSFGNGKIDKNYVCCCWF